MFNKNMCTTRELIEMGLQGFQYDKYNVDKMSLISEALYLVEHCEDMTVDEAVNNVIADTIDIYEHSIEVSLHKSHADDWKVAIGLKNLYLVSWIETFYGDACVYPRTTIFHNKDEAEAFAGEDDEIKEIDISWWTPAAKVINFHVLIEPVNDGERVTKRHDFDNGLSLIYERFCASGWSESHEYYEIDGKRKQLSYSYDDGTSHRSSELKMPWITNIKEIKSNFDVLREKSFKQQRVASRNTFLDREMPYLLVA